jgi:hypothetical protein
LENWHLIESTEVRWLVDGLFPADGHAAIVGKPKAGKSSLVRNLIASVIKGRAFLDRDINIPQDASTSTPTPGGKTGGRVLYVHLDRKDQTARVVTELKQLGITAHDEVSRLRLMDERDITAKDDLEGRLLWLQSEVGAFKPHLVVIDLLPQLICTRSMNDYNEQLKGINALQDALTSAKFTGALVAVLHGRKATNASQPFDDVLGSTALRGSFSTLVMVSQDREEGRYTIQSDQTEREDPWGELDETILVRNPDGTLTLGMSTRELKKLTKDDKRERDIQRLWSYLDDNPGSDAETVYGALHITRDRFLELVRASGEFVHYTGRGVKGDPKLYIMKSLEGQSDNQHIAGKGDGDSDACNAIN